MMGIYYDRHSVSIGPLLSRNGQKKDLNKIEKGVDVSIGPLLSRNGQCGCGDCNSAKTKGFNWATSQQKWIGTVMIVETMPIFQFQLGHFLAEMDSSTMPVSSTGGTSVSIGPLLSRNGQFYNMRPTGTVNLFQLGHFLAEMDSSYRLQDDGRRRVFQLGHFLAEMDRLAGYDPNKLVIGSFNWATSQQKWIEKIVSFILGLKKIVSIGPLLSRNGQDYIEVRVGKLPGRFPMENQKKSNARGQLSTSIR